MSEITAIRHSVSLFPYDFLSFDGIALAQLRGPKFQGYGEAISSSRTRTMQTVRELGYRCFYCMPEFDELQLKINTRDAD
jgi:hypothetical protein